MSKQDKIDTFSQDLRLLASKDTVRPELFLFKILCSSPDPEHLERGLYLDTGYFFLMFYLFLRKREREREKACMSGGGAERATEDRKQDLH